jgi:hypothetical protein
MLNLLESPAPTTYFYHDGRHTLIYMYEPPITRQQFESCVDELLGTTVDVLSFCLGDGRTMLHGTQVGELWGANVEDGSHPAIGGAGWDHAIFRRAHQNAAHLLAEGLDPLQVVIERAHQRGLRLYPCLLAQQPPDTGVRCSTWHQLHADEYSIESKGGLPDDYPHGRARSCFDWARLEVREERLALISEVIEGYDVDGFELQLNYIPYYFHPAEIAEGCEIMTAFVRAVHALLVAKAGGGTAELIVRLPFSLEFCEAQGLDVRAWCEEGIVDVIIASSPDDNRCDPCCDFTTMVAAAAGTATRVLGCVQSYIDSDRLDQAPLPMIRASVCNAWAAGVDGIYVNQWYHMWPYENDSGFLQKLRELPFPEVMAPKDKSYYVLTDQEQPPQPPDDPQVSSVPLPVRYTLCT